MFLLGEEHDGKSDMVVCSQCGDDVTVELAEDGAIPLMTTVDESEQKMIEENEGRARTIWSKTLHHESDVSSFFDDAWFASVCCVREVSGYAVWYRRRLKTEGGESGVSNGDYLLRFYATDARDDAIEFAVLAATKSDSDEFDLIQKLDLIAAKSQRIESRNDTRL